MLIETGAILTHLAPTAIALAVYFCFADLALISQCLYYNAINARKEAQRAQEAGPSEDSPLLARRRSEASSHAGSDAHHKTADDEINPSSKPWVSNTLALLAVHIIGFAGWWVSYKAGAFKAPGADAHSATESRTTAELIGLGLGYISAVFYLW